MENLIFKVSRTFRHTIDTAQEEQDTQGKNILFHETLHKTKHSQGKHLLKFAKFQDPQLFLSFV